MEGQQENDKMREEKRKATNEDDSRKSISHSEIVAAFMDKLLISATLKSM